MFKLTKVRIAYILTLTIFFTFQIFLKENPIQIEKSPEIQQEIQENNLEESKWFIEIPKISLKAEIAEGTTKETLNQYVGHFEKTQTECGNIGLAAHNRGYKVNYFQNIKQLQKGDEIRYVHDKFEKIYEVEKCRIIKDTDWKYLEDTEDNRLTLITCVENQPEYRRCIQAIEKEEDRY